MLQYLPWIGEDSHLPEATRQHQSHFLAKCVQEYHSRRVRPLDPNHQPHSDKQLNLKVQLMEARKNQKMKQSYM